MEKLEIIKKLSDEEIDSLIEEDAKGKFKSLQKYTTEVVTSLEKCVEIDEIQSKMIKFMSMQLAGCCVFDSEHYDENPLILASQEEVLEYYYEKACRELEDAAEDTAEEGKE